MMTTQQLIDLPYAGSAERNVIMQKQWDYDYPTWFLECVGKITGVELTEHQRSDLIAVYNELLEGY